MTNYNALAANHKNAAAFPVFTTSNRKLEQFLYCHDVHFVSWNKDIDGYTVWTYRSTPELLRIVEEFRQITAHRAERRRLDKCVQ